MDIFLSNESYQLLLAFSERQTLSDEELETWPESCLDQLLDYKMVETNIIGYTDGLSPVFEDFHITEFGKGYAAAKVFQDKLYDSVSRMAQSAEDIAKEARNQSSAAQSQAKSAIEQVDLAKADAAQAQKTSRKADIQSIISLIIAGLAMVAAWVAIFR